ncbi:unnamed protein product [Anisakis simplex]|uniref:Uncharacterized protein n=1 Tax=Anisakis simplex TaxID=6269 RepID=A0A3P6UKQ1_ANISI|nr:unnamed protein product [Anisakis simplex]
MKNFIIDTIGILQPNANAKQGLEAVNEFLQSVGRFGESPFLWTFYGSAELPQCFCRLCAVYGGTYCLKQQIDAFIIKNNRIEAIQTRGQRISCKHVIISASYLPDCYLTKEKRNKSVQRAILISNSSVLSDSQKEHVS